MKPVQIARATILGAALVLAAGSSHAQPMPAAETAPDAIKASIKIRNVPVSFIAYWLDPQRQVAPIQIQISRKSEDIWAFARDEMPRQLGNANGPRDLKLPPDVEILASVDPQNVLLVKGTKAGIEALRKMVEEIDVPVNQIEIEANIIEVAPATLTSWPLKFRDTALGGEKIPVLGDAKIGAKTPIAYGLGDFFAGVAFTAPISDIRPLTQKLNLSLADESARVITAPRVTVSDGLTGKLTSTEKRFIDFDSPPKIARRDEATDDENEVDTAPKTPSRKVDEWKEGVASIESQTGLAVAPVMRGDVMNVGFQITLNNIVTTGSTVMRDGQTVVVRMPNINSENGRAYVALIQARIIRRDYETNVIVPGT